MLLLCGVLWTRNHSVVKQMHCRVFTLRKTHFPHSHFNRLSSWRMVFNTPEQPTGQRVKKGLCRNKTNHHKRQERKSSWNGKTWTEAIIFLSIALAPGLTATEVKTKWDISFLEGHFFFFFWTVTLSAAGSLPLLSKRAQLCQSTGLFETKTKVPTPLKPEGPKQ